MAVKRSSSRNNNNMSYETTTDLGKKNNIVYWGGGYWGSKALHKCVYIYICIPMPHGCCISNNVRFKWINGPYIRVYTRQTTSISLIRQISCIRKIITFTINTHDQPNGLTF